MAVKRRISARVLLALIAFAGWFAGAHERAQAAERKAFYIVAHRVNQPDWIEPVLALGANAIEVDVGCRGGRLVVNHDFFDGVAVPLDDYLAKLREIARRDRTLALVIFDTKRLCDDGASKANASALFRVIRKYKVSGLRVIVSVAKLGTARALFAPMRDKRLARHELVAIDQESEPAMVSQFFAAAGFKRFGFGDGIFETCPCPWVVRAVERSVADAARRRADFRFKFVYAWTIGRTLSMRHFIRAGADGILVNSHSLERLAAVLREFSHTHRLARR